MKNIRKLGLGIIAFEGTEHLKNILYEIRDFIDTIVVCLQEVSYDKHPIDPNDVKNVKELKKLGYVDHIIWFKADDKHLEKGLEDLRFIEADKRNYLLDYLEFKLKCSHSLIIDSDEYYNRNDFKRAKEVIEENPSYEINYCEYINYYKDYKHVMQWPFISYVPFITKSSYRYDFINGNFNLPSDPTRRYIYPDNIKYNLLDYKTIQMHHFSFIRLDIKKKLSCWSSKKYFEGDNRDLYNKVIDSYNNFKDDTKRIYYYFNNHDGTNMVELNRLVKEYVSPHFKLDEIPTKYEKRS